jgi:hypothetical protein
VVLVVQEVVVVQVVVGGKVVVVVCGAPVVVLAVRSGSGDPKWGFNNRRLKTKNGGFNTRRWNCRQSTSWLLDPQLFHSVPAIPPPGIGPWRFNRLLFNLLLLNPHFKPPLRTTAIYSSSHGSRGLSPHTTSNGASPRQNDAPAANSRG